MNFEKFGKKFVTLKKVLLFVYTRYPIVAISRDILCVVSTFSEILSIAVLGKFIDSTMQILMDWKIFDLSKYVSSESFLYLALILALWIVSQICTQARAYFYDVIYEKIWQDSQYMMISKVAESNLQDVEQEDYQDKVTYSPAFSITRIATVYDNFSIILSNTIRLASAIIIIKGTMGWSVFLIMLFVLPETIAMHIRRQKTRNYQDGAIGKLKFLNYVQNLSLTISNFLELRVNNIYSYLKRRYNNEYDEYLGGYLNSQSAFYRDKTISSIFGQTLKFGYILYVLAASIKKSTSFGTFKALYDYVDVAYTSIFYIMNSFSLVSINLGYIDKFFDLIEYNGFGDEYHGELKLGNDTPLLEFRNLNFAYPDDPETKILKNINLEVKPGEKVAIFGGDGSGKSTTVKILTGLYKIESGGYFLDGIPTKELDRGELKKKLSVIFQDYINYNFSVRENIVISGQRKNIDNSLYEKATKISGVENFKKIVNIDDESILGKIFPSGKDLSPGYWQRLAIARMLYRNRNIYIMDEPFTYIDDISAEKLVDDIFEFLGSEKSLIYITRSTKFLEKFDRVYCFEKGRIVESGNWKELMKEKGKLYQEYKSKGVS